MSAQPSFFTPERKPFVAETEPFIRPDERTYEEDLQADEATLRARGYTSDFCGVWLGLWAHITREYGVALEAESARMRARKGLPGETAERILEKARSGFMAVMGAARIADKAKSRRRRFKASGFYLEATRRGEYHNLKTLPKDEAERLRRNYGRYWRETWAYIHLVQRVTRLPFVERDARSFKDNRRAAEAALHTDWITDLVNGITAEKIAARGPRLQKFERSVARSIEKFRRECEHVCKDREKCQRPHTFAPEWRPGQETDAASPTKSKETRPRAKVISFSKAKEKFLAGIEIAEARAAAGHLSPAEAEELVTMLAPLVEIATRTCGAQSSDVCGVTLADFDTEHSFDPEHEFIAQTQNENCDFAEENEGFQNPPADKFIRVRSATPDPSEATLDDFLSVFFPDPYEEINLRTFAPKGAPDEPRFEALTWQTCREALACDEKLLADLHEANRTRGIYFVVNSGGNKASDITRVNGFFAEWDEGTYAEQHARFDASPLPPTVRNETLKSVHGFYPAALDIALEDYDEIQRRLIHYYKSDSRLKDRSRVMRLPGFNHVSYNGGLLSYKPVTIARFDPERRFTAEEMLAAFPAVPEQKKPRQEYTRKTIDALTGGFEAWKRELGQRITAHRSARRNGQGKVDCQGVCHNGKGSTGLFYDPAQNFIWCNSELPCDLNTIAAAFGLSAYLEGSAA
jgi:hypothetical protein